MRKHVLLLSSHIYQNILPSMACHMDALEKEISENLVHAYFWYRVDVIIGNVDSFLFILKVSETIRLSLCIISTFTDFL